MRGDGDGWVQCDLGHRHWGLYGAAGVLAFHLDDDGVTHVLLQERSWWSHHGSTWGVPGGARDSGETAERAALREAFEEANLDPMSVRVLGSFEDQHGGWAYTTVLAEAPGLLPVDARMESDALRWVPAGEVERLPLHPGFAATWPALRPHLRPLRLVVDAANVMGSRPDGWWRDRRAAAARLRDQLARLAARGVPSLPAAVAGPPDGRRAGGPPAAVGPGGPAVTDEAGPVGRPPAAEDAPPGGPVAPPGEPGAPPARGHGGLTVTYPEIVLVVEGRARPVAGEPSGHPALRVVAAPLDGDHEIVAQAAVPNASVVVVTADRALRSRVTGAGAAVTGPGWLLGLLDA